MAMSNLSFGAFAFIQDVRAGYAGSVGSFSLSPAPTVEMGTSRTTVASSHDRSLADCNKRVVQACPNASTRASTRRPAGLPPSPGLALLQETGNCL